MTIVVNSRKCSFLYSIQIIYENQYIYKAINKIVNKKLFFQIFINLTIDIDDYIKGGKD